MNSLIVASGPLAKKIPGLGKRIRRWRKEKKKIKSYELARLLDISQGSLSDIENEKSLPSAGTIKAFHEKTDMDIIWLLTGTPANWEDRPPMVLGDKPLVITIDKNVTDIEIKRV